MAQLFSNPKNIANEFNSYFVNVAPKLLRCLPILKNSKKFHSYLKNPSLNSMFLNPTTPNEISKIICEMNSNKALDYFNFPIKIIKEINDIICEPLCLILNKSFESGIFPNKLKHAKITPLHKSDSRDNVKNYRPISILPIFDKVLEKLMFNRLMSFITSQNILSSNQYGFQKNKSTSLAVMEILSKVTNALNENLYSSCIFLDFAKAFDTVNHDILLKKLHHYGIRGVINKWFSSYLSNRTQSVSVAGCNSNPLSISCGVPQGSVLGPILFLLYINDITSCSNILSFTLFADDTALFFKHRNRNSLEEIINKELEYVSDWLIVNKLSLNVSKSSYLFFKTNKSETIDLKLSGKSLTQKSFTKYLGILIDDELTWVNQINYVCNKISQGLGILYKLRHSLSLESLRSIYFCFIQSHCLYGITNWGSAKSSLINKVNNIIYKCASALAFTKKNQGEKRLCELAILDVNQLFILESCKLIYDFHQDCLPTNIKVLFQSSKTTHNYNTRQASNNSLSLPQIATSTNKSYISFSGPQNWNRYCLNIQNANSKKLFAKKLKQILLLEKYSLL